MYQGQLLQMVLRTVPCGALPPLLSTHTLSSAVSGSLLRELLCELPPHLLAVSGSGALGPALIWASPQYLLKGCLTFSNHETAGRKAQ